MQVSFKEKKATLYIISTPIGNLGDITYRAVETLKTLEVVLAEDTRVTSKLFNHYNINTKLIPYHEHNKYEDLDKILNYLNENIDVGLVSDAGTPGISDPGYELIVEVIKNGFSVVSIPGVTAFTTGLVSSGLDIQPFLFYGFLGRKRSEIVSELEKLKYTESTLVFYESPFRVNNTLSIMYEVFGNRKVSVQRELTKIYESIDRLTLKEAISKEYINKGEYLIIVEKGEVYKTNLSVEELYLKYINDGFNDKEAIKKVAKELELPKREVYEKIKINKG